MSVAQKTKIKDVADVPLVVIVGRPNVGKSTLFNRLIGRSFSIVERVSGVTCDVVTALVEIGHTLSSRRKEKQREATTSSYVYELADTGGMLEKWDEGIPRRTQELLRQAIAEADLVIFVVDGKEGPMPQDNYISDTLRKSGKQVILVANKIDNKARETLVGEFCRLGYGEPLPISSLHGRGIPDLRERIESSLPKVAIQNLPEMRIAIIGKRNAGKSTLMNQLYGAERVIVDETPGTTRDAVEVVVQRSKKRFIAIDTAGVCAKRGIKDSVQLFSIMRTETAIKRASVVIFLIDAAVPVSRVDKKLAAIVTESKKPTVVAVNKWDLAEERGIEPQKYVPYLRQLLVGLDFAPLVFISALNGERIDEMINVAFSLHRQAQYRVSTGRLNKLLEIAARMKTAVSGTKRGKIYYATQVGVEPPTIVLFVNEPSLFDKQYLRFIENFLRDHLPFHEVPIRLLLRKSEGKKP